jgi:hypothetical protein
MTSTLAGMKIVFSPLIENAILPIQVISITIAVRYALNFMIGEVVKTSFLPIPRSTDACQAGIQ